MVSPLLLLAFPWLSTGLLTSLVGVGVGSSMIGSNVRGRDGMGDGGVVIGSSPASGSPSDELEVDCEPREDEDDDESVAAGGGVVGWTVGGRVVTTGPVVGKVGVGDGVPGLSG